MAGVGHTNAGLPPSGTAGTSIQTLGYNGPSESQVWMINCELNITAQWTNVDSTQPVTILFYDPIVNYLGATGDVNLYNSDFGDGAYAVTFTYIPSS